MVRRATAIGGQAIIFTMCGRYYSRSDKQRIAEAFRSGEISRGFTVPACNYNIAPTTFQPMIRNDKDTGEREMVLMRWGLVPFFPKQLSDAKGVSTINARAEAFTEEPDMEHTIQEAPIPCTGGWMLRVEAPRAEDQAAFRFPSGK